MIRGPDLVVLLHALMKLGAIAYPLNPGLPAAEREAELERANPILAVSEAGRPDGDRGRPAAARRARPERDPLPNPDQRHLGPPAAGRAHLWQPPLERGRLRLQPGHGTERPLALLPADTPRRRALDRHARASSTGPTAVVHDGFDVDEVAASLEGDGVTLISLVATQLSRLLDAGVDLLPLRADARRRRPGSRRGAGGGDRARRHRRPDLRDDRDRLAGDDARARRRDPQARLRGQARCSRPTCGSRTARSSSRARPSRPAAPTRTAGFTPATSAGSTRRASCTSTTGSAT